MQKKITVSSELYRGLPELYFGVPGIKKIAALIYELAGELQTIPQIYCRERDRALWAMFRDSCFDCENFFEEYGQLLAEIEEEFPVSVDGMIGNLETGELQAEFRDKGVCCRKSNVSGEPFDQIYDMCIHIEFLDKRQMEITHEVLKNLDFVQGCAAVERKWENLPEADGLFEPDQFTYYRYLLLEEGGDFLGKCLDSLTIQQMEELWMNFLRDGATAVEFETLYSRLSEGLPCNMYRWELSLQLALADLGIEVLHEDGGYRVVDADGNRLRYDFASSSAAEKLFLKILFPAKVDREIKKS